MVERALLDAWTFASATQVLDVRAAAAAAVLRRLVDDIVDATASLMPLLQRVVDAADAGGRPLFAANRDVDQIDDPVAALWQATTTLREHRGDGHVAALTAEGVDGCEAHVLFAKVNAVPRELYLRSRGWSDDDWTAAEARLRARGAGHELFAHIEVRTDALAAVPYEALSDTGIEQLLRVAARRRGVDQLVGPLPLPQPHRAPRPGRGVASVRNGRVLAAVHPIRAGAVAAAVVAAIAAIGDVGRGDGPVALLLAVIIAASCVGAAGGSRKRRLLGNRRRLGPVEQLEHDQPIVFVAATGAILGLLFASTNGVLIGLLFGAVWIGAQLAVMRS